MRRTVINTLSLMVLFSSLVYAVNPDRTPQNKTQQGADEFGVVQGANNILKPKIEIPHTNISPPASSAVFSRSIYTYTFAGCSFFTGPGTAGNELTQAITDVGTISTGTLDFTLTTTSWGTETRINISNGTDSAVINPGASSNETSVAYALDITSYVSGWDLAGTWVISVGDSWGDGGGQTACDFTLTVDASSPDLFFSEWIEGSSNNKALELYNPTADTIWLDNYAFPNVSNAPTTPGEYEYWNTFDAGAYVLPGQVFVLAHPSADAAMLQAANMTSFYYYSNGDDGFALVKGGVWVDADADGSVDAGEMTGFTVLDWIGDWDGDPGSGWDVAGVSAATANHTILRDAGTMWGNTDWTASAGDASASEWTVYDQNYFDNLGGYPDDPCFDSLTTVTVVTASYGYEKHFMVQNADGDTLLSCFGCMSSNSSFTGDICLTDGLYSFLAKDSYGDGWDGATFEITDAAGNILAAGTGPTSADGTSWIEYPFAIGIMLPIVSGLGDLDFAGNIIGAAAEESMQIINTGMGDFEVTGITVAGDAFASITTTLTVVPGDTGYIDFTYTPSDEDGDEGSVVIAHNASSDGSAVTDTFALSGYGVDAFFYEGFDPATGSNTVLPMSGWAVVDGNGDASTVPEKYYTWYHDTYGVDNSGGMTVYMGFTNGYYASEQLTSPSFTVTEPAKVSAWVYNFPNTKPLNVIQVSSDGSKDTLGTILPTQSYALYEFVLNGTGDMQVEFDFSPDSGGSYTYMNIDEVMITALPNTYVSGVVTDGETGAAVVGADIEFGGATSVSGAAGAYGVYGAEPGVHALNVSADGYLDSYFSLEIDEGDSLVQNVSLVPVDSVETEQFFTGFESADEDSGSIYSSNYDTSLALTTSFSYYDTSMTDTVEVLAPEGSNFVSTQGYSNELVTYWMNTDPIDLSDYDYATLGLKLNVMTEAGWDYVYILTYTPSFDPNYFYYVTDVATNGYAIYTGSTGGWVDIVGDLSYLTGYEDVHIVVYLSSDESITEGFGVAFDSVTVMGFEEPRPWVENLMAESFVDDQIALAWDAPTGGSRTIELGKIDINNPQIPNPDFVRGNKGAIITNVAEVEVELSSAPRASRDLLGYNVFRTDDFYFADYDGFDLIVNTADASYTDASVDNDKLYYYFVTAVYDEGESLGSMWAAAGAGEVEDVGMEALAVDFNDSTFGLWSTIVGADNGWGIGPGGTGSYEPAPHPDGGLSAYIDDDAIGSAYTSEGWLISPFFNMGDADHPTLTFDYFASSSSFGQELHAWAWIGWDTPVYVGELVANGEWQTVQVDMSGFAGTDHVRIYFYYTDNNGYTSSVAIDNVSIETLDGPANLTITETIEDVTLNWTGLGGQAMRANEYPNGINITEKELTQQLIAANGEIVFADFNINSTNRTFSRAQGDSIGNPFIIGALPYSVTASTEGFTDDYDVACNAPADDVGGFDVVYELTLSEDAVNGLVVDLCESYYDTKVYIFANGDTNSVVACSDDYCTASHGQPYTSFIQTGALAAGTYHIVVDGWNAASFGTYVMEVYEAEPPPPAMDVMYNVYRDGNLIAGGLADSITSYLDETATLNDACYEVTALVRTLGVDGDTLNYVETGYSNEACGSVVNQPPGDFILLTPADGDTVMISLDNIGGNQLFAWNASVDPNGTPVEYVICYNIVAPFDQFCDEGITSTAQFVPLQDIVDYIDSLQQAGHGYTVDIAWQVYASDGMDETEAGNGPRTITFDAGYALGVGDELGVPDVFALHQNYPNPFNPVTTIRFDIPQESHVRMDVYNVMGQRVRTLMNGTMQPGFHAVRWDGTNDMGKSLASGMYIYRIQSSKFTSVKKLVLMK